MFHVKYIEWLTTEQLTKLMQLSALMRVGEKAGA
jgi:hypothetical protein